jgi:hypothetical protein
MQLNFSCKQQLQNPKFLVVKVDENKVKGTKGAKVKFPFQGLHMTNVIFVLVSIFIFYISYTHFNIAC